MQKPRRASIYSIRLAYIILYIKYIGIYLYGITFELKQSGMP